MRMIFLINFSVIQKNYVMACPTMKIIAKGKHGTWTTGPGTKEAAKKGRLLVRTKYSVKKLIMNNLNYIKISTQ